MSKKPIVERMLNRFGFVKKRANEIGYQAAAINRLTNNWGTQTLSIDSIAQTQLGPLRARCRILADQNDYAVKFIRMVRNNVIGPDGMPLKNKAVDPAPRGQKPKLDAFANQLIEDAWWDFCKFGNCTVDKTSSMCDAWNLIVETITKDGEVLIRKVRGFDNDADFAIQILETDYLDIDKNEKLAGGNEIRMGVEVNQWREPIAYWLHASNPNDNMRPGGNDQRWIRVPAKEIIHRFAKVRPEQTRGIPWMAAGAYRLNMLGKYEEAEVTAARTAASKMAFLTKNAPNQEYQGESDGLGNKMMDAEPGAIEELPFGMDVKTIDWNHPNSSYQVFMKTCLRGVAASFGVSYNNLANDMESVNFASGKLGLEEERDNWKVIQRWFCESIACNIFEEWLEVQLLKQNIKLPFAKFEKFNQPEFHPRRWNHYNPQIEVPANIESVKAGFTSITRILAQQGLDRDEVFAEIAADAAAAEAMGIELPAIDDPKHDIAQQEADTAQQMADNMPAKEPDRAEQDIVSPLISFMEKNSAKMAEAMDSQAKANERIIARLMEPAPVVPSAPMPEIHLTTTLDTKQSRKSHTIKRDDKGAIIGVETQETS